LHIVLGHSARLILLLTVAWAACACTMSESRPISYTPAINAQSEVSDARRLDVGITVLDPGLPEEGSKEAAKMAVPNEVRKAEAQFVAYHLKETLEGTAQWGAVRVIPGPREGAELVVSGEIIESTGERLEVRIVVRDATNRVWLDQEFEGSADSGTYSDGDILKRDPFQNIYNEIANALLTAREKLSEADLREARSVAELRFAKDVSPAVFDGYLEESSKGQLDIARLPAEEDPMLRRVRAIRERDYVFVDTLNEHYDGFYRRMEQPYDEWRRISYDEIIALRELEAGARWRKVVGAAAVVGAVLADVNTDSRTGAVASDVMLIGGIELFRRGLQMSKEAKVQQEVLVELGTSFGQDVEPAVIQVAGETRRLEGSAATQYAEWRRLMREIYEAETGFALPASGPVPIIGEPFTDATREDFTPDR